jgi:hypothetical protein
MLDETMAALHPADTLYAALRAAEINEWAEPDPQPAATESATLDAAPLEARWAWSDALDGYGDLRPAGDWSHSL